MRAAVEVKFAVIRSGPGHIGSPALEDTGQTHKYMQLSSCLCVLAPASYLHITPRATTSPTAFATCAVS